MSLNITDKQVAAKKRIGTLDGRPVIEVVTKGGLYLVVTQKSSGLDVLGTGPHRAVARYLAQKREPSITMTELSKSDHVDEAAILSVADKYEKLANDLNDIAARG